MKRSLAVVCTFLVVGVAGGAWAQGGSNAGSTERIVTVNFTAAVLQTAEGQREFGALQTKYAPRQAQLQALNHDVESMRKQLSDDGSKLAEDERQTRERALDGKEKQLQREAEEFRNDSQTESQQVYQRIAQKMYAFLQGYAQRNGFRMVVDRGSDAAPVVWYAAAGVDVTEELIKAYDKDPGTASSERSGRQPAAPRAPESIPSAPAPH